MIFGKIEYLNLLPFHVFMKRYARSSQMRHILHYKRGVPSQINKKFHSRQIDAAFISSITSAQCQCLNLGIIARKEVKSVLLLPGENKADNESASSNILAKVLKLQGEVIIGDKALRYYLNNENKGIDLAKVWFEEHGLPFVFARLCYHGDKKPYEKLSKKFLRNSHKVPQYILKTASLNTQIDPADILDYLKLIEYKLDPHALLSLKRFLRLANRLPA